MEPIVVTDTPRRSLSILLASEQLVVTETRYAVGERGPDPHVHHLHADAFYVLGGVLTLTLENGDHLLESGSFALVPHDVVHSFHNDGPGELHFLNFHAPGMGFDRYVQGLYGGESASFDQHLAPEGGGRDPSLALVRAGEAAKTVEVFGNMITFLAEADETEGTLGVIEFEAPSSFAGPPAHIHRSFHDVAFVLEGTIDARLGDKSTTAGVGALLHAAPDTPHTFSNPTGTPLRFLNVYAPAGFERFFRERAASPEAELASRYDWTAA